MPATIVRLEEPAARKELGGGSLAEKASSILAVAVTALFSETSPSTVDVYKDY